MDANFDKLINEIRAIAESGSMNNERRERIERLLLSHEKHTARFTRRLMDELFPDTTKPARKSEKKVAVRIAVPNMVSVDLFLVLDTISEHSLAALKCADNISFQINTELGSFVDTLTSVPVLENAKVVRCCVRLREAVVTALVVNDRTAHELRNVLLSFKNENTSYVLKFDQDRKFNETGMYYRLVSEERQTWRSIY